MDQADCDSFARAIAWDAAKDVLKDKDRIATLERRVGELEARLASAEAAIAQLNREMQCMAGVVLDIAKGESR